MSREYPLIESIDCLADLLEPDAIVYYDFDQVAYQAAASCEKRTIEVTHKASGRKKVFKTRTEFWGRQKNAVGGWLKAENTNREAACKKAGKEFIPWTREDFDVLDIQTPDPVENCLHTIKCKANAVLNYLGIPEDRCVGVLGGTGNFRLDLPMPERYKANRNNTLRPLLLEDARQYLQKQYNAQVINGIEADDWLAIQQFEGWNHYQKTGKFNKFIISIDKDQRTLPGLVFDPMRNDKGDFVRETPMLIDNGMGNIFMKPNGDVGGYGMLFFGYQMLCGDSADNIKPYQGLIGKGKFGDASAFSLLSQCSTPKEMWLTITDQYKKWFPKGAVKYTDFNGIDRRISVGQWMSIIFDCLYMKRTFNDQTKLVNVLRNVGAI